MLPWRQDKTHQDNIIARTNPTKQHHIKQYSSTLRKLDTVIHSTGGIWISNRAREHKRCTSTRCCTQLLLRSASNCARSTHQPTMNPLKGCMYTCTSESAAAYCCMQRARVRSLLRCYQRVRLQHTCCAGCGAAAAALACTAAAAHFVLRSSNSSLGCSAGYCCIICCHCNCFCSCVCINSSSTSNSIC
jgi:hypothetical protein